MKPKRKSDMNGSSPKRREDDSDCSYRESSTLGEACRITTEDGAGLDLDVKKLRAITTTVNVKLAEKNKKMTTSKISSSQERKTKT